MSVIYAKFKFNKTSGVLGIFFSCQHFQRPRVKTKSTRIFEILSSCHLPLNHCSDKHKEESKEYMRLAIECLSPEVSLLWVSPFWSPRGHLPYKWLWVTWQARLWRFAGCCHWVQRLDAGKDHWSQQISRDIQALLNLCEYANDEIHNSELRVSVWQDRSLPTAGARSQQVLLSPVVVTTFQYRR